MEKTEDFKRIVIVIDEQGNEYESTYPKRAKGLVKSGRARFIGDNKICLVCPPKNIILEEKKMNNNEQKLDMNYIMQRIDEIIEQGKDLNKNLTSLTDGAADAIANREKTNRALIELLKEMLDRLYPKVDAFSINTNIINSLSNALETAVDNEDNNAQASIIDALMKIQKTSTNNSL